MSKNIVIISTSPRKGGNSETLADAFLRGAEEGGNSVEKVCLYDKTIGYCKGCLSCQKNKKCFIQDDGNAILEKMQRADCIVFATPIYFYEMCGQMKTLLDRTNLLFATDYAFREIYLLATAAENAKSAVDGAMKGLQGWLDCFDKTTLAGLVFAGGVVGAGEIQGHTALNDAYLMGKAISA